MSLIVRNDEQIQVDYTVGLVSGSSSFTFDGTGGKPDYRFYEPVFTEISGTNILIKGVDYSWNYTTGLFTLLQVGALLAPNQWYNVHFQVIPGLFPAVTGLLINYQFFILDINIPNIGTNTNSTMTSVMERLNKAIEKYEPECLKGILGYELQQALINETSQRMTDLIYGADYRDNCGVLQHWNGLVYGEFFSLIANYIYYRYESFSATTTTGVSTAAMKTNSAVSFGASDKLMRGWNLFARETRECLSFLWMKKDTNGVRVYPELTQKQYYSSIEFSKPNNVFGF